VLLKGGNIRWAVPSPDGRYLALHIFSTVRNVWFATLSPDTRRPLSYANILYATNLIRSSVILKIYQLFKAGTLPFSFTEAHSARRCCGT